MIECPDCGREGSIYLTLDGRRKCGVCRWAEDEPEGHVTDFPGTDSKFDRERVIVWKCSTDGCKRHARTDPRARRVAGDTRIPTLPPDCPNCGAAHSWYPARDSNERLAEEHGNYTELAGARG